jgi:hypothetical protein
LSDADAADLNDAVAAFNRTERIKGNTMIRVHPRGSFPVESPAIRK